MQLPELEGRRLNQSGNGDCFLRTHRNITDTHLDGVEEWVWADVPPDLLRVVHAVCLDEQAAELFVLAPAAEAVRNVGARKLVEDFGAIAFEAGVMPTPEGRVGGESKDMGQEVAHRVHD